jgi:hypothetical protein
MKISSSMLKKLGACEPGYNMYVAAHGNKEISFLDCVKSKSNSSLDYLWFILKQQLPDEQRQHVKMFAIDYLLHLLSAQNCAVSNEIRRKINLTTDYLSGTVLLEELNKEIADSVSTVYFEHYFSLINVAAYNIMKAVSSSEMYYQKMCLSFTYMYTVTIKPEQREWVHQQLINLVVKLG